MLLLHERQLKDVLKGKRPNSEQLSGKKIGVIVTGGNVDMQQAFSLM